MQRKFYKKESNSNATVQYIVQYSVDWGMFFLKVDYTLCIQLFLKEKGSLLNSNYHLFINCYITHQIVSPILNFESSNYFNEYLLWFIFQLANWKKKSWTIKKFVFFFNCWNWENFMEKISEINWWKHVMNS